MAKYVASQQNQSRAQWALDALDAFGLATGQRVRNGRDEVEDMIGDLLCDLMHYCEQEKLDFNVLLARGQMHFRDERGGEE